VVAWDEGVDAVTGCPGAVVMGVMVAWDEGVGTVTDCPGVVVMGVMVTWDEGVGAVTDWAAEAVVMVAWLDGEVIRLDSMRERAEEIFEKNASLPLACCCCVTATRGTVSTCFFAFV
jgi:hypothetical protein